jgi:hypothetical protein
MSNKDHLLGEKIHDGLNNMYTHLSAQMFAPFLVLSNFFLTGINVQTDVVKLMNKKSGSKYDHGMLTLETSKISPKVYSILLQKAQEDELEDYIVKLVEQDLDKLGQKEEAIILFDKLREEFLGEINLLKQEFVSGRVVESSEMGPNGQSIELRDFVTKHVEQKLDKEEFQALLNSFRREFLNEINLLKNKLAFLPDVPINPNESKPAMEDVGEVNDFKEGQLLESDKVTGTIKEVIDMDF